MPVQPPRTPESDPARASGPERNSLFGGLLSALGPPLLLFLALPLVVYGLNRDSVDIPKTVILESGLLAAAVVAATLWLLGRLPRIGEPIGAACDVLSFTIFFLILLPNRAGEITGMGDELAHLGNRLPLLKAGSLLVLAALWYRFRPGQFRTLTRSIVETAAIGSALVVLFLGSSADRSRRGAAADARQLLALGSHSNVVVLVLDSFTGYRLVEILESRPELRAALDGFTLYPRAIASALNTLAGSSAILTGDLRIAIEIEEDEARNTRSLESSFLAEAHQRGFDAAYISGLRVAGSTISTADEESLLPIERPRFVARVCRYSEFLAASSARVLPERAVRTAARLAARVQLSRAQEADSEQELLERVTNSAHRNPLVGKLAFDRLLDTLHVGRQETKLLFVLSVLSHEPWNLTEDGRFEIGAGPERTSIFAARSIVRLVERLRELGSFENSLVIVAADHGFMPIADASMGGVFPPRHRLPREFNPLLMVKPPHSTQPLRVSDMTVWLGDIAATARDALELPEPEDPLFESRSLLLPDDPARVVSLPLYFRPDHLGFHSALKDWVRVDVRGKFADFGAAASLDPAYLLSRPTTVRLRSGVDSLATNLVERGLWPGEGTQYAAWIEIEDRLVAKVGNAGVAALSDAGGRFRLRHFENAAAGFASLATSEPARHSFVAGVGVPRRFVSQYLDDASPTASEDALVNCVFVASDRARPRRVSRCSAGDVEVAVEWP